MQQQQQRGAAVAVVQSLTPEAARILKQAVAEAAKRGHAQATPLHVAACLLLAPNSPLRAACLHVITSNNNNNGGDGGSHGASMGLAAHPYNNNNNNNCDEKANDNRATRGGIGNAGPASSSSTHHHHHHHNLVGMGMGMGNGGMPRCRALELCFNIALDRLNQSSQAAAASSATPLPTTTTTNPSSPFFTTHSNNNNNTNNSNSSYNGCYVPSYSNALVAALKRAQAHQRRGCPDTQQQQQQQPAQPSAPPPLLAVRVELLQLVVSILDDPSVSRVMREAGFSSTAVKSHLEDQIIMSAAVNHTAHTANTTPTTANLNIVTGHPPPNTSNLISSSNPPPLHHNQQQLIQMMNHYNPSSSILGTYNYQTSKYGCKDYYMSYPAATTAAIAAATATGSAHNIHPPVLNNNYNPNDALFNNLEHLHRFIPPPQQHHHRLYGSDNSSPASQYMTISSSINPLPNHNHSDSHITHHNPAMGQIINQRHEPVSRIKHGASSCLTPLRYEGRHNNSESLTLSLRRPPSPEQITVHPESSISYTQCPELELEANNIDSRQFSDTSCCSDCTMKYEKEAHLMMLCEEERFYNGHESNSPLSCSSSVEPPTNCTTIVKTSPPSDVVQLPSWLQKALSGVGGENRVISASTPSNTAQAIRENKIVSQRLKELQNKWSQACKSLNHNGAHSNNDNYVIPNLNLSLDLQLQSSSSSCTQVSKTSINPPPEPILNVLKKSRRFNTLSENQKIGSMDGDDALMRLCKGLHKRVSWQPRVISTLAHTVALCRSGLGVKRGLKGSIGSSWLLFLGEDRHGKREMAEALAELVFGEGKKPIYLQFNKPTLISSSSELIFKNALGLSAATRGKMPMDSMVEALRANPSSLVLFEDLDWADSMSRNALLKAMEKGRMVDTNGRDVSFNNAIVIMTSSYPGTNANSQVKVEEPPPYCQQESLTMHNKRKGGNLSDDLRYGPTTKRSCLNASVCLDLNMSVGENVTDDVPVTDHHCISSTNGAIKSQFVIPEDESVLRAFANKQHLQGFCDLADAVLVFDPPPL